MSQAAQGPTPRRAFRTSQAKTGGESHLEAKGPLVDGKQFSAPFLRPWFPVPIESVLTDWPGGLDTLYGVTGILILLYGEAGIKV